MNGVNIILKTEKGKIVMACKYDNNVSMIDLALALAQIEIIKQRLLLSYNMIMERGNERNK